MRHWRLYVTGGALVTACVLAAVFLGTVAFVIAVALTLVLSGAYAGLVYYYWTYTTRHNEAVRSGVDEKKEKVEELDIDQTATLFKKGFVERGPDRPPLVSRELWEQHNGDLRGPR